MLNKHTILAWMGVLNTLLYSLFVKNGEKKWYTHDVSEMDRVPIDSISIKKKI